MFKIPIKDLKDKIVASGKCTLEELDEKIKSKVNELSGLISEEGAAHIIANEFGVVLVDENKNELKIKEIYAGMKNVHLVGKVTHKFEVREFAKGDKTGKVCSIVVGDETGTLRVVFWNDQVNNIVDLKPEDTVKISNAYVKDNNGNKEIHMGDRAEIDINPEGVVVENVRQGMTSHERKKIGELQGGDENAEILGTVVQVFDPRFWNICTRCNRKVMENNGVFNCNDHGEVQPGLSCVMNVVLDDGSGTIRSVFWKNQTIHLLGKTEEEVFAYKDNAEDFEDVKTDLLGEQLKVSGRVKRNDMFERLEFSVQMVEKAKPEEEIAKLEG